MNLESLNDEELRLHHIELQNLRDDLNRKLALIVAEKSKRAKAIKATNPTYLSTASIKSSGSVGRL